MRDSPRLLFVTSEEAIDKFTKLRPNAFDDVFAAAGDHLVVLNGRPGNVHDAAAAVREQSGDLIGIDGVVIVGDYDSVPAWSVTAYAWDINGDQVEQNTTIKKSQAGGDSDAWKVWTDDLYGAPAGYRIATIPVSRIPILPQDGFLGNPYRGVPAAPQAVGLHSDDSPFAGQIFDTVIKRQNDADIMISPPYGPKVADPAHQVQPGAFAADHVYIAAHGQQAAKLEYDGRRYDNGSSIDAVDDSVVGGAWRARGVTFTGACWGALLTKAAYLPSAAIPIPTRSETDSIALAILYRGANAVVGFTAAHYVAISDEPEIESGTPLHLYFWENIIEHNMPPAKALLEARVSFLRWADGKGNSIPYQSEALKTFWSATCLGYGW